MGQVMAVSCRPASYIKLSTKPRQGLVWPGAHECRVPPATDGREIFYLWLWWHDSPNKHIGTTQDLTSASLFISNLVMQKVAAVLCCSCPFIAPPSCILNKWISGENRLK